MPTTAARNLQANDAELFPASGQFAVGNNLANRHIDTVVNLSNAQLDDATLTLQLKIEVSYDAADPPPADSWVTLISQPWVGGTKERDGVTRAKPRLSLETTNVLPEWARQVVTPNKNLNQVSLTATAN